MYRSSIGLFLNYPSSLLHYIRKTVTLPEILFDDSLILSPYIFLKGILFKHQAFKVPSLTCPNAISRLDIHPNK